MGALIQHVLFPQKSFVQLDEAKIVIADGNNNCLQLFRCESEIMTTTFSGECGSSGLVNGDGNRTRFFCPLYMAQDLKSWEFLIVLDLVIGSVIRLVDICSGNTTTSRSYSAPSFEYFIQDPLTFDLYVNDQYEVWRLVYDNVNQCVKCKPISPTV